MYLDQAKKVEIFNQYGKDGKDTGSVESQVALFTYRIQHLTEHLKKNHKDFGTARSLTKMVGRRRKLLKYLYNRTSTAIVNSSRLSACVSNHEPTNKEKPRTPRGFLICS